MADELEQQDESHGEEDTTGAFFRRRCPFCRRRSRARSTDTGAATSGQCPLCGGGGHLRRARRGNGLRSGRARGILAGHHRVGAGRTPLARGPLLPLSVRAENYEPPPAVRHVEPVMPAMRPSLKPFLDAYSHLDEREGIVAAPSHGNIESADLIVSIAKATNLDALSLSQIRLADVLWGNSAIYIQHGAGSGQQVHIPPELRNQLYHYLQDCLVAGVPDDPEGSIFQESIQDISECLARAEAQERWKSLSDPVDALLDNPCAANGASTDPPRGVLDDSPGAGPRPGADVWPLSFPSQCKQPGSDLITDSLTAGPQKSPTAMVDAIMGVSETSTDLPDKDRNSDILGIAGNTGINLL